MKEPTRRPAGGVRRPYRSPELVEYGSVATRTLGQTVGSFPDSMGGLQKNPGSGPPPMCY